MDKGNCKAKEIFDIMMGNHKKQRCVINRSHPLPLIYSSTGSLYSSTQSCRISHQCTDAVIQTNEFKKSVRYLSVNKLLLLTDKVFWKFFKPHFHKVSMFMCLTLKESPTAVSILSCSKRRITKGFECIWRPYVRVFSADIMALGRRGRVVFVADYCLGRISFESLRLMTWLWSPRWP